MITSPAGFRAAAVAAGIKTDRDDLALIVADRACAAAAVFTQNRARAAPVEVSREHLRSGRARAVVVNAGCANAATGEAGLADAREMAACTATAVGCAPEEVVVASTGVIGVRLPMDKVRDGIARAARGLSAAAGDRAACAILTTDTRPKTVDLEIALGNHRVRLSGMAKGAGMIGPNMATLLAFFTTDAAVAPALLRRALQEAVPFWNQVVDRTAGGHAADQRAVVAERNAAIHAARALFLQFFLLHVEVKFVPVLDALDSLAVVRAKEPVGKAVHASHSSPAGPGKSLLVA